MKTGIIGLGAMGAGMARNLHRAGHLTALWNRSPERVALLEAELGIERSDSPAALAEVCELIITCVSADADLLEVIAALRPGLRAGTIILDTSTVGADTARRIAEDLAAVSVQFLDSPVSGGSEGAAKGTLAMMVGGDAKALERILPALQAITARVVHMGPVGSGQATKAVNQIMCAGINQAVTEALAFSRAEGLDMEKVIEVVSKGAAGNWFLEHRGHSMLEDRFPPGFRVALHAKDLRICQHMAAQHQVHLDCVDTTLIDYDRLIQEGHGDEDISALFRLKRGLFEPDV